MAVEVTIDRKRGSFPTMLLYTCNPFQDCHVVLRKVVDSASFDQPSYQAKTKRYRSGANPMCLLVCRWPSALVKEIRMATNITLSGMRDNRKHCPVKCVNKSVMSTLRLRAVAIAVLNRFDWVSLRIMDGGERRNSGS